MFFLITNVDKEKICEYKGNIFILLKNSLHESLALEFVIILITFFFNFENFFTVG
jgi:hypothetical protein